ncbi:MAG: hypothetical protein AABY22_09280, partial [Nanoarchaeota archaeon]
MKISISIYCSHDSSICVKVSENEFRIYEIERLLKKRYCSLNDESDSAFIDCVTMVKDLIEKEYGIKEYGSCFYGQTSPERLKILKNIFGFDHF